MRQMLAIALAAVMGAVSPIALSQSANAQEDVNSSDDQGPNPLFLAGGAALLAGLIIIITNNNNNNNNNQISP